MNPGKNRHDEKLLNSLDAGDGVSMQVGVRKDQNESVSILKNGIRLKLAPRSANAKQSIHLEIHKESGTCRVSPSFLVTCQILPPNNVHHSSKVRANTGGSLEVRATSEVGLGAVLIVSKKGSLGPLSPRVMAFTTEELGLEGQELEQNRKLVLLVPK
ncbi:hypothetical protein Tco_0205706 [Tanacetum coccineum]